MTPLPPRCPYCARTSVENLQYADRRMTVCSSCGAWFTWPQPTPDAVAAQYAGHDEGMPARLREWREDTVQSGWYDWLTRRIASIAERSGTKVERIADVGAGALELSRSLSARFPDAHVSAQDLFADRTAEEASSGPITRHHLDLNRLSTSVRAAQFDVVACVAVLEHVIDPVKLLAYLGAITAEGGFAYVVGPLADSWARRIMRSRWPYYSPDDHLTLPTRKSLRHAVALAGGGEIDLHRIAVRYSSRYFLRFFGAPEFVTRSFDILIPVPAGAFELIWHRR